MKRLFALKDMNGLLVQGIPAKNGPLCFETKKEAKDRRDEINREDSLWGAPVNITYGPDHRKWNALG